MAHIGASGARECDALDAAAGEGARVVVAAVEAGDGGDAELAEEGRVVLRAEDAAAAVDVGAIGAGRETAWGGGERKRRRRLGTTVLMGLWGREVGEKIVPWGLGLQCRMCSREYRRLTWSSGGTLQCSAYSPRARSYCSWQTRGSS